MAAFITGIGKTRFGPSNRTLAHLAHEAIAEALRDAELSYRDLDAFVVANFLGGPNDGQLHLNAVVASSFPGVNLPSWRVEAACASGGVAVHQATLALSEYRRVLVVGVERLAGVGNDQLTRNIAMAGDALLDQAAGLSFPATYALVAQRHMAQYGTTVEDLDAVSLKNHANARLNPKAHFHHKVVTAEDVRTATEVASPLRLFDCCPVSDGAAAVIVESAPRDARSVEVLASTVASDAISLSERDAHTSFASARAASQRAYEKAGLGPHDLDLAQVHDCFTIAELVALEDLGLAAPGDAGRMTREGETALAGRIPVNTDGGLKAGGHAIAATGVSQVGEIVTQLRGEAGERQVDGARTGLAHNVGGVGGTCTVTVLGRR